MSARLLYAHKCSLFSLLPQLRRHYRQYMVTHSGKTHKDLSMEKGIRNYVVGVDDWTGERARVRRPSNCAAFFFAAASSPRVATKTRCKATRSGWASFSRWLS